MAKDKFDLSEEMKKKKKKTSGGNYPTGWKSSSTGTASATAAAKRGTGRPSAINAVQGIKQAPKQAWEDTKQAGKEVIKAVSNAPKELMEKSVEQKIADSEKKAYDEGYNKKQKIAGGSMLNMFNKAKASGDKAVKEYRDKNSTVIKTDLKTDESDNKKLKEELKKRIKKTK